jgi:hypothetical protein
VRETRGLEIDGYDPVNKDFSSGFYMDDGSTFSGVLTVTGKIWTYTGKMVIAGKQCMFKETLVLAPDLTRASHKGEVSVDGKTWEPWFESKWTKAKPAAKK